MFWSSYRYFKRFVILVPGLIIFYLSATNVLPFFERRLPLALAALVTYILAAYVFIPAAIRVLRIFFPPKHLPLYCVTPDGFASDPLNVAIIGTRRQVQQAMRSAGWYGADGRNDPRNIIRHLLSTLFNWSYVTAPVSSLFLFGRKQDLAFQLPIDGGRSGNRHHVRFWATTYDDSLQLTARSVHWHQRSAHVQGDDLLWVGAASLDNGLAPIRHNLQITHMIHPDTNQERDLIVQELQQAGLVARTTSLRLRSPYKLINRAFRGQLHSDGKMTVIYLKPHTSLKPKLKTKPTARASSRTV